MVPSGRGGMEGYVDLKRVIREQLPTYGSKRCQLILQVICCDWTWNLATLAKVGGLEFVRDRRSFLELVAHKQERR
jgi:hypothetical protein